MNSHHFCVAAAQEGGLGDLKYPLVADLKKEISSAYQVSGAQGVQRHCYLFFCIGNGPPTQNAAFYGGFLVCVRCVCGSLRWLFG